MSDQRFIPKPECALNLIDKKASNLLETEACLQTCSVYVHKPVYWLIAVSFVYG